MATRTASPSELERAASGLPVVLYDGACRFCSRQALTVRRLAGERVHVRPLQEALDELPWVDPDEAVTALTLVRNDGSTVAGAQAIVELLRLARPTLGALATLYYLPGLRQLADLAYRIVAARRYALFGTTPDHAPCDDGACGVPWVARAPADANTDTGADSNADTGADAGADEARPNQSSAQSTSTGRPAATSVRSSTPPSSDSSQRE